MEQRKEYISLGVQKHMHHMQRIGFLDPDSKQTLVCSRNKI